MRAKEAKMSHGPEPWSYEGRGTLVDADDESITYFTHEWGEDVLSDADAERIVACVNACAGIPTEALAAMPTGGLKTKWLNRKKRDASRPTTTT